MGGTLFHRQPKPAVSLRTKQQKNLTRMQQSIHLLTDEKRQNLLTKIRELVDLEDPRYKSLCSTLIDSLVNYCQQLPETANSFYSAAGGVVDYALNRTEAALSMFKDFMVQDSTEPLSEIQKLWQYTLFSAAILQGIGKLFVDYQITLFDANGNELKQWNPLLESLIQTGSYYDYAFEKESEVEFRRRLNLLLAQDLMPLSGYAWIASNPEILRIWLALLNEDLRSAGTLGALLIRADAIAKQRYLSEFMSKTLIHKTGTFGRAGTFTGGTPESLADKSQAVGVEFLNWLTDALSNGKVIVNKAPLFMVPGGMLMSQEMFQLFVKEHPEYKNWQAIQSGFLSLGLHAGDVDARFEQSPNNQVRSGVVFSEYAIALSDTVNVHDVGTGTINSMSAMELINKAQTPSHFTQQQNAITPTSLQKLDASGQWKNAEKTAPSSGPGARRGV